MNRNHLLDIYRVILTISVLLYHLGLCEAGFLAVCGFFTISGYLLATSINNYNFNLKDYYLKRLKTIYIPLLTVVLVTVFVFRYVIDIPWVSIKQEVSFVLFAYNNFFQIKANSNYFIRSDASVFTHMWYISILIQYEILIPLIVTTIHKYKIELNKKYLYLLTFLSIVVYVLIDYKYSMAVSYYNTLSRLFSFLIGYSVYYIDYFSINNAPAIITLIVVTALFFVGNYAQKYYVILMILVSLLSGLFILLSENVMIKQSRIINYICKISYYIYLVQYPIIYIVNNLLDIDLTQKIIIEFVLIILVAFIFYFSLSNSKHKLKKYFEAIIIMLTLIGLVGFLTCPNYNLEMKKLEKQLETNQEILAQRQLEFLEKHKDEQDILLNNVSQIDEALNNIDETVKNTKILMIGDSIMLGGSFHLDEYFNNYYCDAKGSRNGFLGYETLKDLLDKNIVGDYIVIHLGTNSGLELEEVESIASLLDGQKVLWLTVTNGWRTSENPMLEEYCNTHDNNYLIDWYNYSLGHKEYFGADGLHLSDNGRHIYDQLIFDSLKEVIKEDLIQKRKDMINDYNSQNNTVSFYGNDLLINLYKELSEDYLCYTDANYDFDSLYQKLSENKDNLNLSKTIFILLDNTFVLTDEQVDKLTELLNDYELHIFAYNHSVNDLNDILSEDLYLNDKIHLNEKGNNTLVEAINNKIK